MTNSWSRLAFQIFLSQNIHISEQQKGSTFLGHCSRKQRHYKKAKCAFRIFYTRPRKSRGKFAWNVLWAVVGQTLARNTATCLPCHWFFAHYPKVCKKKLRVRGRAYRVMNLYRMKRASVCMRRIICLTRWENCPTAPHRLGVDFILQSGLRVCQRS